MYEPDKSENREISPENLNNTPEYMRSEHSDNARAERGEPSSECDSAPTGMDESSVNSVTGSGRPEEADSEASNEQKKEVDGEYHFVDPEATRAAYSDAGYVPSDSASAVPPRYHCSAPAAPKEKKSKERKSASLSGIIAACLVCAILGGVIGGSVTGLIGKSAAGGEDASAAAPQSETVLNVASPNTTSVSTNLVVSGDTMSSSDIYDMACTQVVAVTTEITYTNVFGYTSSGAVSGSGFIISSNGYILTNYHVISDADKGGYDIKVLLYDGTEYNASIVGYEEENDVAVLKIDAVGLNAVTLGNSDDMKVGEDVYAIGNPLGELQYTMTSGMVSALDREISSTDSTTGVTSSINMFQIDAAVNSGNSGGPVYNSRGEVIGIVTAKYSSTGVEGLGFAIPINDAISIANDLMTNGYVTGKAYMGVVVQTVSSSVAQYYNMVEGAYVYSLEENGCAQKSGLRVGDIIVSIDDTTIASSSDLVNAKKLYKAGESAALKVYRSGEYLTLTITFDEDLPSATTDETSSETPSDGSNSYSYYGSYPYGGQSQFGGSQQQRP